MSGQSEFFHILKMQPRQRYTETLGIVIYFSGARLKARIEEPKTSINKGKYVLCKTPLVLSSSCIMSRMLRSSSTTQAMLRPSSSVSRMILIYFFLRSNNILCMTRCRAAIPRKTSISSFVRDGLWPTCPQIWWFEGSRSYLHKCLLQTWPWNQRRPGMSSRTTKYIHSNSLR